MPRPRLEPSQRQRAVEACNLCRETKKRCSGTAPCTHCLRRGIGDACYISNRPRRHRSSAAAALSGHGNESTTMTSINTSSSPPARPSELVNSSSFAADVAASGQINAFRPLSPSESRTTEVDATVLGDAGVQPELNQDADRINDSLLSAKPSSRMLLNLRGERVYIGGGASLSFLQLIRSVVTDQIGPSQFSRHGRSDTMLEKESPQSHNHVPSPGTLSAESKLMHAEYFYAVTGGIIDPFAPQELEGLLTATTELSPTKKALTDVAMAIGLQCEPSTETRDRELSFFREAQTQAFAGMLEDPDIDMVRMFLIMAFYLLGECRRNTAFMYLGIAARAAVALGLHSKDTYGDMGDPKHQLRLRVWMSLRVLDIVVNSLLGRPAATAGVYSDVQGLVASVVASTTDRGIVCLGASYNVVGLIITIVDRLYDKKEISIPVVEELLQDLEKWSQDLPEFLRTPPSSTNAQNSSAEKGAIGRVHVSVFYYFAVTLVTRPILISTLMHQPTGDLTHSHIAAACLDAASFIVHTCSGARKHKLLRANMCLLKAIVFPAGLVLGFETFAKGTVDYGIESAFHGARDILSFLSTKSPQAALYHDILTSLSNAITQRRGRMASKGRSSYVSRLFNFDRPVPAEEEADVEMTRDESHMEAGDEDQRIQIEDVFNNWSLGQNTPVNGGEVFLDWDSLDISQWDSFPYTT